MKMYFYQSDYDSFAKDKDRLADMAKQGDITFAYTVYNTFLDRIDERVKMIDQILDRTATGFHDRRGDGDRQGRGHLRQDAGGGQRALAEADQVRLAAAEGREGRKARPTRAKARRPRAARSSAITASPSGCTRPTPRVAGDVSHQPDHGLRSAHHVHVALVGRELRDHDGVEAGRHRGLAARRRRLHRRQEDHPRRGRRKGRPPQARRQDHRRGRGRKRRTGRRRRHEAQRRGEDDPRQARHGGPLAAHVGQGPQAARDQDHAGGRSN